VAGFDDGDALGDGACETQALFGRENDQPSALSATTIAAI